MLGTEGVSFEYRNLPSSNRCDAKTIYEQKNNTSFDNLKIYYEFQQKPVELILLIFKIIGYDCMRLLKIS
jgi:hypothetical protein